MVSKNKLFEVVIEATEKVKVLCTVYAKNAAEAKHKLSSAKPWTNTEDEISRIELGNWKVIGNPKEIKES